MRRTRLIPGLLSALLLAPVIVPPASAQDDVAAWLEDHDLKRLLLRRLEQALEGTRSSADRAVIAQSLAEAYASLLDSMPDGEERSELEARARGILELIEVREGDPLRLALLRSAYAEASRQCELHRLVLDPEVELETLADRLDSIARELGQVRERLARNEQALERRINRTRGIQAEVLGARSDTIGLRIAQATYLEAWARAYVGWIRRDRAQALEAQELFGRILATGEAFPSPSDISRDLRSNEIYAESILGIAFAKGVTDSIATVRIWLDLLRVPETAPYVAANLDYWQLALLTGTGAHGEALEVLRGLPDSVPTGWVRLAAVSGLGATGGGEPARALGTEAVALLAARGELAQVVDLAERFGLADLDRAGFALQYVSGVCRYDDARTAAEAGDAARARALYGDALADLDAALAEPDRTNFEEAIPGVIAMRAWCLHELGRYREASDRFEEAAELHAGTEAGNHLWMAITALDRLDPGEADEALDARQARLIERFLTDHPSHPSAPSALLRRFAAIEAPTFEDAEALVLVPSDSPMGARAHQQGVQMLYRIFNRGEGEERIRAGRRFLDVVPVPRFETAVDQEERDLMILRARQLLDVALHPDLAATGLARRTLDAIDLAVVSELLDIGRFESEIDYRRLVLTLLDGDVAAALEVFGLLEDAADDWRMVAARALYNASRVVLEDPAAVTDPAQSRLGIDALRRSARLLLGDDPVAEGFEDERRYRIGRTLARAERLAHESNGGPESLRRAHELHLALIEARPLDQSVLEGLAWSSEATGDLDQALATHRQLVSGSAVDSEAWYRRKHDLLRLLSRVEPGRAREVLDQHLVLHPDYGPDPWGPRLRELHERLETTGGES